jgi:hypothetical protein
MLNSNQLGIFMDHASAHLMNFMDNQIVSHKIESKFTHQVKSDSLSKGENLMHDKEQQQQGQYYKAIAEVIKNYKDVIIFGPTDAKLELANSLKKDNHFSEIKITVETTDKLDTRQQEIFTKNYFTSHNKENS